LDTGRPVGVQAIAADLGVSTNTVNEVLGFFTDRGSVQWDGEGPVVGIAGISVQSSRHTLVLRQGGGEPGVPSMRSASSSPSDQGRSLRLVLVVSSASGIETADSIRQTWWFSSPSGTG
jgi:hypothetical protein